MPNSLRNWLSHLLPTLGSQDKEEPGVSPEPDEAITVLAILPPGGDRQKLQEIALSHGWKLLFAETWVSGVKLLNRDQSGVVLVDSQILEPDWQRALRILRFTSPASCLIPILPRAVDRCWQEFIQEEGYNSLTMPLNEAVVIETIQLAWSYWKASAALEYDIEWHHRAGEDND